jgi:hypothetical protein
LGCRDAVPAGDEIDPSSADRQRVLDAGLDAYRAFRKQAERVGAAIDDVVVDVDLARRFESDVSVAQCSHDCRRRDRECAAGAGSDRNCAGVVGLVRAAVLDVEDRWIEEPIARDPFRRTCIHRRGNANAKLVA